MYESISVRFNLDDGTPDLLKRMEKRIKYRDQAQHNPVDED